MKITAVTVGYSRLVTTGGFNNVRHSCELTAEITKDDITSYEAVRDLLQKKCEEFVESKIAGEELIVVSKEKAEKLKEVVKAIQSVNQTDLPF
jgi:hypothetical protein